MRSDPLGGPSAGDGASEIGAIPVMGPVEGLRERKKRLMRQQISDTATLMFLERGFEAVRVAEVAAACGVSEKTVFNYFPTKESLLLDREETMAAAIWQALGPGGPRISPVEAMVDLLIAQMGEEAPHLSAGDGTEPVNVGRFMDLIERNQSLRAAQFDMMERLAQVAAEAMAARAGVNPDDPEPQIAADALVGLWRIYYRAIRKYNASTRDAGGSAHRGEVPAEVIDEVRRAARLIDTGLWSFALVVQGSSGRAQLALAAEASNEARKQVMAAIKQARDAWRTFKAEIHEHAHEDAAAERNEARRAAARLRGRQFEPDRWYPGGRRDPRG